ncbi:MAG: MotA/TolQ/ExbB proton channel family protein [Nitrospira sp.]|jgi:biopolymer transport protein TolQ|nr:MotA/TolQ/ExbB proton channel family protein [Nitrospira sp. BO4]
MFQAGPLGIIASLGIVSKVVLLILVCFSIISWAIIFYKWATFRAAEAKDRRFMAVLLRARDVEEVTRHAQQTAGSPCAKIFHTVVQRLGHIPTELNDTGSMAFDRHVMERTAAHLAQGQISKLESYLPFLATTGNISPFVGLLGTVMGIIDSFREIGTQGTASIAAVAPGVSEALIATAAGLFAAIPAVIAYNYFLTRIRRTALHMDSVVVELLALVPAQTRPVAQVPVGAKG